jgi:putative nucleotidyltransferase with HDIG domain
MHPVQRAWLRTWAVQLDPRRQPSVSGATLVSAALRAVPARALDVQKRSLASWPAVTRPTSPRPGSPTLQPRSMGGHLGDRGAPRRRTAELLSALSSGLDAAENRPRGHAVRTAIIAVHIAESMERTETTRAALLYASLLRDAGTTGRTASAVDGSVAERPARIPAHLSRPDRAAAVIRTLTLPAEVAEAVCSADERWNGHGPARLRKDGIPLGARIVAVASVAAEAVAKTLASRRSGGHADLVNPSVHAVGSALRAQRGKELDPKVVDACLKQTPASFWRDLIEGDPMALLLEAEPAGDIRRSTPEHVDSVCATFADLVDTRTPMMGRHGVRVGQLAERVASRLAFDELESRELRRAGLLHDIGKLLVPIAYLEKAAELTPEERAVIQDHPRVGAEILRRSRVLAGLAPLVEGHHERLDGEGHFPEFPQPRMALAARILAVCDRYEAMTSERPYRPLLTREQVWRLLEQAASEPMARQAFLALRATVEYD